jgi:hypothetical protein
VGCVALLLGLGSFRWRRGRFERHARNAFLLGLVAFLLVAGVATRAWAVDPNCIEAGSDSFSVTTVIHEDDGFPGVCAAPCLSFQATIDFWCAGSLAAPGYCSATEDTYVYTLLHIGGTLPPPNIPGTEFELAIENALTTVASASWDGALLPPPPGSPGTVDVDPLSVTVSRLDVVSYGFPDGDSCPNCFEQFQTSAPLFLCADANATNPTIQPSNASVTAIGLAEPSEVYVPRPVEPGIEVAPPNLDFGMVDLGDASLGIVTITNVGNEDRSVEAVALTGGSNPAFTLAPLSLPAVLPRDGVLDVEITFTPTVAAIVEGTLEVTSDDPDSPLLTVSLVGEGVPLDDPVMALLDEVFDPAVDDGTLVGDGPGSSGPGRLRALRNMIEAAGDLIDTGFIDEACDQLLNAQKRADGLFPPPDFVTGPSGPVLYDEIGLLRSDLGCAAEAMGALREAAPEPPPPPRRRCGFGLELALLLPPLAWWRSRRRRTR